MRGVFLDFASLGPADIDTSPLTDQLPGLTLHLETAPNEVASRIAEAEVVVVNKVRLDDAALAGAPHLKLVCLAATGTDNVDLDAARSRDIGVCNIRDYCTPSVVQHVFTLILALTNNLREYDALVRDGAWQQATQFCLLDPPFRELDGKTLGIVGLGTLGSAVADVARAFGMRVLAAGRPGTKRAATETSDIERVALDELLQRADIVSLHCPLTPETENLIDAGALTRMRDDALLINTARGRLVDPDTLVAALRAGDIAGAGIDVLREEPPEGSDPLLDASLPNLIVTPHIAWAAREARQRAVEEIAANVAAFKKGEARNRVD